LKLLLFDRSQFDPNLRAIGITKIADFGQYIFDVENCLLIVAGNGGADEFQAFNVGGRVDRGDGRSSNFYLHGFFGSFIK
jgi:hypothetical protein